MNDQSPFRPARSAPVFGHPPQEEVSTTPSVVQPENTPENKALQPVAAAVQSPATARNTDQAEPDEKPDAAYTVSVDEARKRLAGNGFARSKDTIQRYCRDGTLDARKLGMLSRYFITEASLNRFISDMQVDATAPDQRAPALHLHEASFDDDAGARSAEAMRQDNRLKENDTRTLLHADVQSFENENLQTDAPAQTEASDLMQVHEVESRAGEMVPREQLDQALEEIKFLREEVRDARLLKRDLKDISSEMLQTFSKVAASQRQLGGAQGSTVTRFKPTGSEVVE